MISITWFMVHLLLFLKLCVVVLYIGRLVGWAKKLKNWTEPKKAELLLTVLKLNCFSSVSVQNRSVQFSSVTKIQFRLSFYVIFFNCTNNNNLVQFGLKQFGSVQNANSSVQFSYFKFSKQFSLVRFSFHPELNHAHP